MKTIAAIFIVLFVIGNVCFAIFIHNRVKLSEEIEREKLKNKSNEER